jgi:hypothetical protein
VTNAYTRLILLSLVIFVNACHRPSKTLSFYYWRTVFYPDTVEYGALEDNDVQTLYLRYFDVDWPDSDAVPSTARAIRFDTIPDGFSIIPVILLHNRVFEKMDSISMPAFADKILAQITRINLATHQRPTDVQFDCDWNERTKNNYFHFLRLFAERSGTTVSSTIRLYQIRYPERTGVPPVDHGVLIFYNMGNDDTVASNPIYERSVEHRFTPSLRSYPLTMDLALPIVRPVSADDLLDMVDEVNRHSNHHIRNLIFFDLDHQNLRQYDRGLLKEILDHAE